jgi:hypothetical protein
MAAEATGPSAAAQAPEEILQGAWARVEGVERPFEGPDPGTEWHFATGAQWALGCAGLLTDEQIRRWEDHGKAEARRLRPPQTT